MTQGIELVLFDVGGVLGTNGWDRHQRAAAVERFHLDESDFETRHEELVTALESGRMTLDDYLDRTVFREPRAFTRQQFRTFMFELSEPWSASIGVARDLSRLPGVRVATLNNESLELNEYRIREFGLRDVCGAFFSSCWLGIRKPSHDIYARVLGMTQADPARTLFVDDREENLLPASALGIRTIHFQSANGLRDDVRAHGLTV
jgi:putative hydrolase of the HAD superfamily